MRPTAGTPQTTSSAHVPESRTDWSLTTHGTVVRNAGCVPERRIPANLAERNERCWSGENRISFARATPHGNHYDVSDVTTILDRVRQGDAHAAHELIPLVYDELRRLASYRMANEAAGHTLEPTALVHEAWLRLGGDAQPQWHNRAHFFAAAGEAMRRILIDRARKRAVRRASGLAYPDELHESRIESTSPDEELLAVHDALDRLDLINPTAAELVKLRYFTGMSLIEAARNLDLAQRSAERLWAFSRAWLRDALANR